MYKSRIITLLSAVIWAMFAVWFNLTPLSSAMDHRPDSVEGQAEVSGNPCLNLRPATQFSGESLCEPVNYLAQRSSMTETFTYLPVVFKRWPPIPDVPIMLAIQNDDGNGNYAVDWEAAYLADTYQLHEDDNLSFSSPVVRYSGSTTYFNVSGKSPGTYYYRVQGCNGYGCSAWSEPARSVTVLPPNCVLSVKNDTGGKLCYEVQGTGIGEKCFSSGTHGYGSFPAGSYRFCVRADCGRLCDDKYFEVGPTVHRFWCGYADAWEFGNQLLYQPD